MPRLGGMTRRIERPTVDDRGADVHPAFGMIGASRGSSTPGQVLFDSDIRHGHTVTITLYRATRKRDLNHDWVHGGVKPLAEVEMSEAQWASFVSTMNVGSGVPCTIRKTETDWDIPGLPYDPRLAHSMDEVRTGAHRTFDRIQRAMAAYDALDPKCPAKERRAAIDEIRNATRHAQSSLDFAARALNEHAENVVQRARADIEAMVLDNAAKVGLAAGQAKGLVELPAMDADVIDAPAIESAP